MPLSQYSEVLVCVHAAFFCPFVPYLFYMRKHDDCCLDLIRICSPPPLTLSFISSALSCLLPVAHFKPMNSLFQTKANAVPGPNSHTSWMITAPSYVTFLILPFLSSFSKIESLLSPMHKWKTVPLSSVMMPSAGCVDTPEPRWCRNHVPAASCMVHIQRDQRWPRWLKHYWEQRRGEWRWPSTLKKVFSVFIIQLSVKLEIKRQKYKLFFIFLTNLLEKCSSIMMVTQYMW